MFKNFSVRINYLKKSHKVTLLNYKTGITKEKLINLTLNGNISLSKKGVNDVIALYESFKEVSQLDSSTDNAIEYADNKEVNPDHGYNISLKYFLETLKKRINTVYSGNINAMFFGQRLSFFLK